MANPPEIIAGDPAADARGFRQCLGQFSTGVTIVAADQDGVRVGVTANSFSSLSLDPPLILWSIARTSRSYPAFVAARHFAVSILSEDQVQVSQRFASSQGDKFATIDWRPGSNGAPVINGSAGRLECSTETIHEGGDHALIIGRVTRFEREARKALIFSQGRYSIGLEHPVLRNESAPIDTPRADAGSTLGALVFKAHLVSARSFDQRRGALGLSAGGGRILYVLSENDVLAMDELVAHANLPGQIIEDALGDLEAKGCVHRDAEGRIGLTEAGRMLRLVVRESSQAREDELLHTIAPERLAVAKQVLAEFIAGASSASLQPDPK